MLSSLAAAASMLWTATPCNGMGMIYYGGNSADYATIEQYPPEVIVPADIPTLAANVVALHAAGVSKVIAYIPTACANTGCFGDSAPLSQVEGSVDQAMADGADGLFFDEGTSDATPGTTEGMYYASLYNYVKTTYGQQVMVVVNPGVAAPDLSWFTVPAADVVCLECDWQSFRAANYPGIAANRFWGLASGSQDCGGLYTPSAAEAVSNAQSSQSLGVGYFYETSAYVTLPTWYPTYYQDAQSAGLCQAGGWTGGATGGSSTGSVAGSSTGGGIGGTSGGSSTGGTTGGSGNGPLVTQLFLARVGSSTPLTTVQAGGNYDLVLGVSDPGGFAALGFADLWWSAPGVSVGTIANRGGAYLPGQNDVLSYSLAPPAALWAEETPNSASGWVDITNTVGLYANGNSYAVDAQTGLARATITLATTNLGTWTLSSYVQELPFGGTDSPLVTTSFTVVSTGGGSSGGAGGVTGGSATAGTSTGSPTTTGGTSGSSTGGPATTGGGATGGGATGGSSTGKTSAGAGSGGAATTSSSGSSSAGIPLGTSTGTSSSGSTAGSSGCNCSQIPGGEAALATGLILATFLRRRRR